MDSANIEKLGLHCKVKEVTPSIEHKRITTVQPDFEKPENFKGLYKLGEGVEGEGYFYVVEHQNKYYLRVIKVLHNPIDNEPWTVEEDDKPYEMSSLIRSTAANARWADSISNPDLLIARINEKNSDLEGLGYYRHHYDIYQTTNQTFQWLKTTVGNQGYLSLLRQSGFPQAHLPQLSHDLNTIMRGHRGGLGSFFNKVLQRTHAYTPSLTNIPKRMFPDFHLFGVFPDDYGIPGFSNRPYMVSEFLPETLTSKISDKFAEMQKSNGQSLETNNLAELRHGARIAEMKKGRDLVKHFPHEEFEETAKILRVMHSYRLALSDLTEGNIGIDKNGNTVILDPGSIGAIGSPHLIATLELLPSWAKEAFSAQQLKIDPRVDWHVLQQIVNETKQVFDGFISDQDSYTREHDRRDRDKYARLSSMARKRS